MKWKLLKKLDYESINGDLLTTLLKNREVHDIKALLNVNKNNTHHWSKMKNIKEGVDSLLKHINSKSHIHIIVDCDCDGYTSFAYIYNYIFKNFNVECTYHTHSGKQHGISLKELQQLDYFDDIQLLIVPDGGSYDYKAQQILSELGKEIIVLDHHNLEEGEEFKEVKNTIVINPQIDGYPNKTLSGVGVVHKFCEALDEICGFNNSQNYLDLVACGCVADNMDLRNLETRYYVLQGIKQLEKDKENRQNNLPITGNSFIQAIIKSKEDNKLKYINIESIGWEIAPLLNGMARFGRQEEKIDTFRALTEQQEDRWYQPRRKNKEDDKPEKILKTLQEDMVRICSNAKGRQDKAKSNGVKKLEEKITEKNLNNNKILIVNSTDVIEDATLTGVVANGLANKYKKPCIVLRKKNEECYGGSGRNYAMSPIPNFNKFLSDTNCFTMVSGHDNAFGIEITNDKLFEINDVIADKLQDITMEDIYLVDYEIPIGRLSKQQVIAIGELKDIWGNTLPKPKFAITNVVVDTKDIELMGEKRNILKFKKHDISFIKFFANEDLLNEMKMKKVNSFGKSPKTVEMDIICYASINEYEGVKYPQLEIIDFNVRKAKEILF